MSEMKKDKLLVIWSLERKSIVAFCPPTHGQSTCLSSKLILLCVTDVSPWQISWTFELSLVEQLISTFHDCPCHKEYRWSLGSKHDLWSMLSWLVRWLCSPATVGSQGQVMRIGMSPLKSAGFPSFVPGSSRILLPLWWTHRTTLICCSGLPITANLVFAIDLLMENPRHPRCVRGDETKSSIVRLIASIFASCRFGALLFTSTEWVRERETLAHSKRTC